MIAETAMNWCCKTVMALAAVALAGACTAKRLDNAHMSGFLEDYGALEPVERGFLYTSSAAKWSSYDKVLLPPVTIWRAGRDSLDDVH